MSESAQASESNNLPAVIPKDYEPIGSVFQEIENPKKRAFLVAVSRTSEICRAAQIANINIGSHYHWSNPGPWYDPQYVEAFKRAKRMSLDYRESEIIRRGFHGYDKPIIHKGQITGYYKEYSDLLAVVSMNADNPEKYHRNPTPDLNSAPVTINIVSYSQTVNVAAPSSSEQVEQVEASSAGVKIKKW